MTTADALIVRALVTRAVSDDGIGAVPVADAVRLPAIDLVPVPIERTVSEETTGFVVVARTVRALGAVASPVARDTSDADVGTLAIAETTREAGIVFGDVARAVKDAGTEIVPTPIASTVNVAFAGFAVVARTVRADPASCEPRARTESAAGTVFVEVTATRRLALAGWFPTVPPATVMPAL